MKKSTINKLTNFKVSIKNILPNAKNIKKDLEIQVKKETKKANKMNQV